MNSKHRQPIWQVDAFFMLADILLLDSLESYLTLISSLFMDAGQR